MQTPSKMSATASHWHLLTGSRTPVQGRNSAGSRHAKLPGATFYIVANVAAGKPWLLVVQEGYAKNKVNTADGIKQSWGPPGGQRDHDDRNRFVTGQREFKEETGFPWQAILDESIVKCVSWYLVEGDGLDDSGDRWVLLLPQPIEVVTALMGLSAYVPMRNESKRQETLDLGWISFQNILDTMFPDDPRVIQPLLPITDVLGRQKQGALRSQYSRDTKQVCYTIVQRILAGQMSYCSTNNAGPLKAAEVSTHYLPNPSNPSNPL